MPEQTKNAAVSGEWKLVPVAQLKKWHRDLDACQKVIWLRGGFDPEYCLDAQDCLKEMEAVLTAPVPHAGGEVEVLAWRRFYTSRTESSDHPYEVTDFHDNHGFGEKNGDTPLVDRAHVTRLQAENEKANKACELWLKLLNEAVAERDALKAEVERLKSLPHGQILAESAGRHLLNSGAENFVGDVFTIETDDGVTKFEIVVTTQKVGAKSPGEVCSELQSELTKARELLSTCNSGFKDFISDPVIHDIESFLAHQSAPAAKESE